MDTGLRHQGTRTINSGELPGTLLRRVRLAPGLVLGLEALFEHDGRRAAERLHDR